MREKNAFEKFLDRILKAIKKILERVTKWFYYCKDKLAKSKLGKCVTNIKNHFTKAKISKTQEEASEELKKSTEEYKEAAKISGEGREALDQLKTTFDEISEDTKKEEEKLNKKKADAYSTISKRHEEAAKIMKESLKSIEDNQNYYPFADLKKDLNKEIDEL